MPSLNTNLIASGSSGEIAYDLERKGFGDDYQLGVYSAGRSTDGMAQLGRLFSFFRNASEGRYSDRSLMRILRASEGVGEPPFSILLEKPFRYDEDTETKSGGPVAGLLAFEYGEPNEDFPMGRTKLMLCTAPAYRRKGIGRTLLSNYLAYQNSMAVAFVHRTNNVGLQFAGACGMSPQSLDTATGVVRMAQRSALLEHDRYDFVDSGAM